MKPENSRQPATQRREPRPKAELDQKGIDLKTVDVQRKDLVQALDQFPDSELASMTARKLWQKVCEAKRVACDGVLGGEGPPRRPTKSQSSQISQVLAQRRARSNVQRKVGSLAHSQPSTSLAQLAVRLVGRYGNAEAVMAEFELLNRFVTEAGGVDSARQLIVIARVVLDGQNDKKSERQS